MESFQQQALGFALPSYDFEPDTNPEDGEQYLQNVFYERSKCPAVVVKPFPVDRKPTVNEQSSIWNRIDEVNCLHLPSRAIQAASTNMLFCMISDNRNGHCQCKHFTHKRMVRASIESFHSAKKSSGNDSTAIFS